MNNLIQEKIILMRKSQNRKTVIIHNLRGIKTLEDSYKVIKRDILEVFENAQERTDRATGCVFYDSDQLIHFIYAEAETEAGNFYNDKTSIKI